MTFSLLGTNDGGITHWQVGRKIVRKTPTPKPPPELDSIADAVLAYRPKPKSKGAKRRTRRAKKSANDAENS